MPGPLVTIAKPPDSYDLRYYAGLVPRVQSSSGATAALNRTQLNSALAGQWQGGTFTFDSHRPAGAVERAVKLDGYEYNVAGGPIVTSTKHGAALSGPAPTRGYYLPTGDYEADALGGMMAILTRTDGTEDDGQAVLRLRGTATYVGGLELRGRPWLTNPNGGQGPTTGTRTQVGIEVEGRAAPASGRHTIESVLVADCKYGIVARAGYYDDDDEFVDDENHADMVIVDHVMVWGCDECFRFENVQAVGWVVRALEVEGFGGINAIDNMVVFNIVRGGDLRVTDSCNLVYPRVTLVRVDEYSPWTRDIRIEGLIWDLYQDVDDAFLTLFEYAGSDISADMSWLKWQVRVTGHIKYHAGAASPPDMSRLLVFPAGCETFPLSGLLFDLTGLEDTPGFSYKFDQVDNGQWYRPTAYWTTSAAPRSRWKFDEGSGSTVTDSGTPAAHGTITGSVTRVAGISGEALQFTAGAGNYVNVPDEADIRLAAGSTVSFWIKLASYTNGVVLSKFHTTGSVETGFRTEASGSHFYVTENAINRFDIGSHVPADGEFHHVALTVDGSQLATIYVDGTSRGTATLYRWFDNTSALRFGAPTASFYTSGTAAADMTLDDVRFYGIALTAEQVDWLYQDFAE